MESAAGLQISIEWMMVPTEQFDLTGIIALILLHWFYWDYWVGTLDFFVFFLSLWIYLWLAETGQQPISQTTWLQVTPHCNQCNHCNHWMGILALLGWQVWWPPNGICNRIADLQWPTHGAVWIFTGIIALILLHWFFCIDFNGGGVYWHCWVSFLNFKFCDGLQMGSATGLQISND